MAGYYSLAAGAFDLSCLPQKDRKKLPKHPVPTVHLGWLAVDRAFRGKRLGETLLFHKYGFVPLKDNPLHLYLPMKTVQAMFDP